jgi:glycosyltransferase involved in cell wall biosynthesis
MVLWGNLLSPKFLVRALMLFPKTVHMAAHMKQRGIAHIHAHYATHPTLMAWIIHKLIGISYSVTVHAHDIFVDRSMLATKLRDASFIVAISEFNRQFLIRHVGEWVTEKIHVVHCGIDPQKYSAGISRTTDGKFNIVSIGSLQPYKGMKYLIEACALLKDRALPIFCKIIGAGEERSALDTLISQSGLRDCVELVGAKTQSEVAQLLRDADCYAQPSVITPSGKMEGIPVALMEALSCGLPVIASNLSGIPELVRHNETGYLVPPADANALANALEYVYNHSEEAGKLASVGCGLVCMEFEIQKNVAQLAELFSEKLSYAGHEG